MEWARRGAVRYRVDIRIERAQRDPAILIMHRKLMQRRGLKDGDVLGLLVNRHSDSDGGSPVYEVNIRVRGH
jgi:hypothetical protein